MCSGKAVINELIKDFQNVSNIRKYVLIMSNHIGLVRQPQALGLNFDALAKSKINVKCHDIILRKRHLVGA